MGVGEEQGGTRINPPAKRYGGRGGGLGWGKRRRGGMGEGEEEWNGGEGAGIIIHRAKRRSEYF